ncbi:GNAT family N-acetyltransferase [Rhodococcus rhodnii]|uniref:GNAT family N-acetyltransferase n=1 Tax=Rhodococcus rhodnii TaxID=38312 RepID=A0A6P2CIR1_9NOCA|nr:GNAT family N-acetyltransferase [Rhodococcus rhodnii]
MRDLDPVTLYRIMALRTDVFVHEQRIVDERELDDRDLETTTTLYWADDRDGRVLATLRVLRDDPAAAHLGRVATARDARGRGVAAALIRAALADVAGPVEISAQAYLEGWYRRFGFETTGPGYVEAGIDHIPMRHDGERAPADR